MATDVIRYINLAQKIKMKSDAGQINWVPASFAHTYEASLGADGMVAIQKLGNNGNSAESSFSLAFKNGLDQTFYNLRESENRPIPNLHVLLSDIYSSAEAMKMRANGDSWLSGMETFVDAL